MVDVPMQSRERSLVRFRGGGFEPASSKWVAWIFFALVLVGWELASHARLIDPLFLPAPSQIWNALRDMIMSGEFPVGLPAS